MVADRVFHSFPSPSGELSHRKSNISHGWWWVSSKVRRMPLHRTWPVSGRTGIH